MIDQSLHGIIFYNPPLNYNPLRIKGIEEMRRIYNETVEHIRNEFEHGNNPLNISQNTYFLEYPWCLRGDKRLCDTIKQNIDTEKLYEKEGYILHLIDV